MTACPTFGSWEEFHAYRFEEPMWRPLVYEVLDRHGIARPARLAMTSSVHVVAIAGPVVVKLYQPLSDGDSWAVETGALRLLGPARAARARAAGHRRTVSSGASVPLAVLRPEHAGRPLDEGPITTPDRERLATSGNLGLRLFPPLTLELRRREVVSSAVEPPLRSSNR